MAASAAIPERLQPPPLVLTLRYLRRNKTLAIGLIILAALAAFTVVGFLTVDVSRAYPLSAPTKRPPRRSFITAACGSKVSCWVCPALISTSFTLRAFAAP